MNSHLRLNSDVVQADPDTLLSDDEVALIRESLAEKVGGAIEYTPWRGDITLSSSWGTIY
jgi:ATP-dependent RNA helicase DDX5/DBP2